MTVKAQIFEMIDLIPETDLITVLEVVRHFVPVSIDDIATADDITAHNTAMMEYTARETIPHDAINWD